MTSRIDIKDIQTPLIPQEIWLIEQFSNHVYFKKFISAMQSKLAYEMEAAVIYCDHIDEKPTKKLPKILDRILNGFYFYSKKSFFIALFNVLFIFMIMFLGGLLILFIKIIAEIIRSCILILIFPINNIGVMKQFHSLVVGKEKQKEKQIQIDEGILWLRDYGLKDELSLLNYLKKVGDDLSKSKYGYFRSGICTTTRGGKNEKWDWVDREWMKDPKFMSKTNCNYFNKCLFYENLMEKYAENIDRTFYIYNQWCCGELQYDSIILDADHGLTPPNKWPQYYLDINFQCATNELIPKSGIYLPAVANSCPKFLIASTSTSGGENHFVAPKADIGQRNEEGNVDYELDTIWTLVECVP